MARFTPPPYERTGYHELRPKWRRSLPEKKKSKPYIGLELEVISNTGSYQDVLDLMPRFSGNSRPITEMDGSLPSHSGVEIVFPPFLPESLKSKRGVVSRTMEALKDVVYEGHQSAGLHINVNVEGWQLDKLGLFAYLFHHMDTQELTMLGGRNLTMYCEQQRFWSTVSPWRNYCGKYSCVYVRNNYERAELRFPGSTVSTVRLNLLVDLATAASKFITSKDTTLVQDHNLALWVPSIGKEEFFSKWKEFLASSKKYSYILTVLDKGFMEYEQEVVSKGANKATRRKGKQRSANSAQPAGPVGTAVSDRPDPTPVQSSIELGELRRRANTQLSDFMEHPFVGVLSGQQATVTGEVES